MKTLFIAYCTEYEAGWGQRPDGFVMAEDKEAMIEWINETGNSGSPSYFWRYDSPSEVHCSVKTYNMVMKKLNEEGVAHFDNGDKSKMELFKQI